MIIYWRNLVTVIVMMMSQQTMAAITFEFSTPLQTDNSIELELRISGLSLATAPSISAYDLDIHYDSGHLQFDSATLGDPLLGNQLDVLGLGGNFSSVSIYQPGSLNLYELSFDWAEDLDSLQAANFSLATLRFDVLKTGSSFLQPFVNELVDSEGNVLFADSMASAITTVPLPTALGLMLTALSLLLAKGIDE